jgi:hypothetical protein
MNRKDPHEQQAMQPLVSAFRQAMHTLDCAMRTAGTLPFPFESWGELSQLAQTLVHQFDNQTYELAALRRQLEETQLASQKLKTQFDYREKREAILEQAYVETQLALQSSEMLLKRSEQDKYEIQKHARHLERSHASLVAKHGEVKAKAEQFDAVVAEHQRSVHVSNATFNDLQGQIGDLKGALAIKSEDNSRLRMLARNRRHALIEVGNFLASDLAGNRTPKALSEMIEKVAAMARPVDYRTGEALEDRTATAEQLNGEGAILPLTRKQYIPDVNMFGDSPASDTPETGEAAVWYDGQGIPHYDAQPEPVYIGVDLAPGPSHTVIADGMFVDAQPEQEVAEQLGYSKRAHNFPLGGDESNANPTCTRCGIAWLDAVDDKHYCQAVEADDNGVHLAAQITSVAEAIENGQH